MSVVCAVAVPHPPIIRPEVGRGEERKIQKTIDAYRSAMRFLAGKRPDTVVVLSPHSIAYADYFHISPGKGAKGDLSRFHAGSVRQEVRYDEAFIKELAALAEKSGVSAGTDGERDASLDHGTVIPLSFLTEQYADGFSIVRIGLSGLSPLVHYRLGMCIREASEKLGRRTAILASGDLSHKLTKDGPYGFAPEGPEFDKRVAAALGKADFLDLLRLPPELVEAAAECGLRAFLILAGALDKTAVNASLLSYEGPFGVGYAVATFDPKGADDARDFGEQYERAMREEAEARHQSEDAYVRLARLGVETYVKTRRKAALPKGVPDELLNTRAGAFVTLHEHGRLRGCIGTIEATQDSVAEEILQNAVSASSYDPRFAPVSEDELAGLVYSVDVLGRAEPVESAAALDPKRYGVIVESGNKRGLLLPDLDGIDTPDEQIAVARQKAGIGKSEPVRLSRFEVVRHH